ncbi:MAG: hypothetical protein A2Y41_03915 [Spirochaetes bacterium GWB1_36_13]|nr:MAG: hypothetical protein A2Y41_03915 [Spirochaetes bacterium GWB1_36_13]
MLNKVIIFCIILISPAVIFTAGGKNEQIKISSNELLNKFAYSKEWLKLLHYKKNVFSNYKSQIDSQFFFLSLEGKTNPYDELLQTINFFNKNNENAYCRFPARYDLIKKKFNLDIKFSPCQKLDKYINTTKTDSLSIAFSSYYIDSPVSIFGHTFTKLNSKKSELFDYAINFFADVRNVNSIQYILGGLFGNFKGYYKLLPYHYKVREYNDYENRDIWLYRLKLSEEQIDFFLKHNWELMNSFYDYFFFTENCAYHVLSALEAAVPEYNLTDETKSIVLPVETLKILVNNNLVDRIDYNPSLRNIFLQSYSSLNDNEKKDFHEVVDNNKFDRLDFIPISVLDSAIDYYNFKYPSFHLDQKDEKQNQIFLLKQNLSQIRSNKVKPDLYEKNYTSLKYPHLIHNSNRFSIYFGRNSFQNFFIQPEFRFLFHDLNDSSQGYAVNATIEFMKISGQFLLSEKLLFENFYLNEFKFLKMLNYNDFSFYQKKISWGFDIGASRILDKRTDLKYGTFAPETALYFGLSKIFFQNQDSSFLFFCFIRLDSSYSNYFINNKVALGTGPEIGLKLSLGENVNLLMFYRKLFFLDYQSYNKIEIISRFHLIQNFAIDLKLNWINRFYEYYLGFLFYF